jgi:hypothetical protein
MVYVILFVVFFLSVSTFVVLHIHLLCQFSLKTVLNFNKKGKVENKDNPT